MGMGIRGVAGALVALASCFPAHAQPVFRDGFETPCSPLDLDGDRLTGCQEALALTDAADPDTDGDGLKDGDELLGTMAGLALPAMGVDPRRKDVLVEMDWVDDAYECAPHSHRVTAQIIEEVRDFYDALPVPNPNGVPGINFIADFGQGGVFTGGNLIPIPDGITSKLEQPYFNYKNANFAANRRGYFRYQLQGHRWEYNQRSSGVASIGGDDGIVTLQCRTGDPGYVRNTIIHEFGHNLGLRHGGDSDCNEKPNYNSLMNYNYQFFGIDIDCDGRPDGVDHLGYSDGSRNTLDHAAMDEAAGVCPTGHPKHQAIDWNGNGVIDAVKVPFPGELTDCGTWYNPVPDWDDYTALQIAPNTSQDGGAVPPAPVSDPCPSLPDP